MIRTFPKWSPVRGLGAVLLFAGLAACGTAPADTDATTTDTPAPVATPEPPIPDDVVRLASCANSRERESITVRTFQTQLMVAALTCGAREEYNTFILRYRPHLTDHGHMLKRYFQRAFGRSSQRHLDHYVTELANNASQISNGDRAAFCAHSQESLNMLLAADKREAGRVLAELAARPAIAVRNPAPACDVLTRR